MQNIITEFTVPNTKMLNGCVDVCLFNQSLKLMDLNVCGDEAAAAV